MRAVIAMVVMLSAVAASATGQPIDPPCVGCLILELTPAQAEQLPALGSLRDLPVALTPDAAGQHASGTSSLVEQGAVLWRVMPARPVARAAPEAEGVDLQDVQLQALRGVILRVAPDAAATEAAQDETAFSIKRIAAALHGRRADLTIVLDAPAALLAGLLRRGAGPYVDAVIGDDLAPLAAQPELPRDVWRRAALDDWSLDALLRGAARTLDRTTLLRAPPGAWGAEAMSSVRGLLALRDLLPPGLTPLPDVAVECVANPPSAAEICSSNVFLNPQTLDAIAVVRPTQPVHRLAIRPGAASVDTFGRDGVALMPLSSTFVARIRGWQPADRGRFSEGVNVTGRRDLSVAEIIARHQAVAARQRALVRTLIQQGRTVITFNVPGFTAPVTITSETTMYVSPANTELQQQSIKVNGLDFVRKGQDVPRLPIIEPERVSTPPLSIMLTDVYAYRLAGREPIEGRSCYVVEFAPRADGATLFRGRVWIAADTFAMRRISAAQTGLRGPIISSEQRDEFVEKGTGAISASEIAPVPFSLLTRSEIHQMYEGAGHRTPIHRVISIDRHEVNTPDFETRRADALASDAVMLRETPEGFRYLRRGREGQPGARVVAGQAQRVRTLAMGVIIDPNITRPLPFAGVNYADFNFLKTGTQLNAFFGGTYGQVAWAVPSLGRTRWQLFGNAFGTAAEYNDRSFRQGIERYDENVRQRPLHIAAGVLRPLSARTRMRVAYEMDYTHLARADSTGARFIVPVSPLVHGVRMTLEAQRGPWVAAVWWNPARRQRWREWGRPGGIDAPEGTADFQRYGVTLDRSFVFSPRLVGSLETAWMGGRDLDRFSRFAFGSFDNRLRGYPSASVRYDRGGVARSALSWTVANRLRLDGFADMAVVRDPGFGRRARGYPGIGAAIESPLPLGVLGTVEWGYGFQARGPKGDLGTHVIRVTGYKVF